jgi:peptidyl-prolyl cis-trans isomerase SurA
MKNYLLIFFLCLFFFKAESIETKIIHKIQNEIITNIDIKNEFKYLIALNNNLKQLDKDKILNISNESIIREKIKKIELQKNFKKITIEEEFLALLIKEIYLSLNLRSLNQFISHLKNYNLTLTDIKKKITIDALWNQLIIQKYSGQIKIDEEKIRKNIINNKNKLSKEFELSEIIFTVKNKNEINKKYNKIIKSVQEVGFKNSASLYSISDSAKIGGGIGWINENSLNTQIKENIKKLKIGETSKPIILSNGILILKVTSIRKSKNKINLELELKKAINYEKNRQLKQYSKIYFNKTKKNLGIDE